MLSIPGPSLMGKGIDDNGGDEIEQTWTELSTDALNPYSNPVLEVIFSFSGIIVWMLMLLISFINWNKWISLAII